MTGPQLAVIGGGPKAMALAAKVATLAAHGFTVPRVVVIERTEVGANWTGRSGYTSGRQPLGTSPEKDVGFPYQSACWGPDVGHIINAGMATFSWQTFLVDSGGYADWVDRGRPSPEHRQWAQYLQWVAARSEPYVEVVHGEAVGADIVDGRWVLEVRGAGQVVADGLVMTGPGRVLAPVTLPDHPHLYTVETFWPAYERFRDADSGIGHVAIVGSGETAAAVALGLVQLGNPDMRIDIVSPLGMAFSRGESFRENRVYTDPAQGNWAMLTPQHRKDFIRRTDRGVFSQQATKLLDQAEGLEIVAGRVVALSVGPDGRTVLDLVYNDAAMTLACDAVVMATGADQLIGVEALINEALRAHIQEVARLATWTMDAVEGAIQYDISLRGLAPRLHLPMLASFAQGPGFANLSCLGRLSDRILEPYVTAPAGLEPRASLAAAL